MKHIFAFILLIFTALEISHSKYYIIETEGKQEQCAFCQLKVFSGTRIQKKTIFHLIFQFLKDFSSYNQYEREKLWF